MKQLLVATHNPAKKLELKGGFIPLVQSGVELLFLDDLHITNDPEETGKTFKENALLKAKYFANLSHLPTVADDGGIEIDKLNGEPGIHAKRWLGRDATDQELVNNTLQRLDGIPFEKRTAHFQIALCYYNPLTKKTIYSTASLDGVIAEKMGPNALKGFPYRSLFIVDKYQKYYDEMTDKEHVDINHRLRAVKNLLPLIKEDLLQ